MGKLILHYCVLDSRIYSLFAGQPLALLNATGPVLVFEGILYSFCR